MPSPSPNKDWSKSSTMSKRFFPPYVIQVCGCREFCHSSPAPMWALGPTSDQSVDEGSSFIRRIKLGKTPSPCLSYRSDRSMGEPPRFNENISPYIRMKLEPGPSPCLSYSSDRSMGEPPRFSNEINSHIRMKLEPGPSPCLSYSSDRSMGEPPRFSNESISPFIRTCTESYWEKPSHEKQFSGPQFSKRFKTRPTLKKNMSPDNTLKQAGFRPELAQSYAGPGDMACDICTGKRMRAVKWCLTCSVAYCETHVRQHYTVVALQRHQLRDVTEDPETRICYLHYRALEVFCKTDQIFICFVCVMEKHKDHDIVLAKGGIHAAEEKLSAIPHQSAIHLERMHIRRCIEELTVRVKSLERAESELSHLSKRFFRGLQEAQDVTSEFVEVAALGRRLDLGMLYDCRSESFSSDIFLWEKNLLSSMKLSIPRLQSDVRILDGDSLQDRLTALDLSVSLRASVVSGMVEITGASEFINHPVQSQLQDRVTLHDRTSTRLDMLSHELLHKRFLLSLTGSTTATHVVVAVLYGSQAFFVFDSKKDRSTENTNLKDLFTKMIASSDQTELLSRLTEVEKTASFIDGVVLQSSVDTVLQNAGEVPLKVWLYPLKNLFQTSACVVKDISQDQLHKAENVLEKLKMDISFSQTLMSVVVGHDVFTQFPAVKDALSEFSSLLQQYQSIFQRKLASCIKTIRDTGALEEEEKLQDLLDESNQSPFRSECRPQWLQNKNAEVTALIQCKSAGIKILNNQNDVQRFVQDCQADKVLGLIFTSLEGEDPFLSALRQNDKSVNIKELSRILGTSHEILSDLHSLILKKTTSESIQETMFIAASVTDFRFPAPAIHLYQSGELVSRNVKLHIKPNPSEIITVQQTRVTMKLQSLKTNTQYYRVEYRAVKEDRSPIDMKWRVISCTGENCVVSHLAPGTHYQLRYSLIDSDEMTDYSQVTEFQTAYRDRPGAPTVLKPNKDSLYIAWQRAESDEDSPVRYYMVEYLEAGLEGWQSVQTEGPVCECRISLPYSTCYRARVSAVYRNGDISTPSDETKVPVRVWSIDLSKRKASIFLEVLRKTTKKCVKLRDCTDEESEVKSFLQCLSYISQLSVDPPQTLKESLHAWRKNMTAFLINLCLQAAIHQKDSILETVQKLPLLCFKTYREQSAFLLDLYSCVTDYEARTGQKVRPALQAVYQKLPEIWSINLSEKKASFFLEVLKLQTVKKAVELRGWSEEENEIRSLLQCLPYISKLSFVPLHPQRKYPQERRKRVRRFLLDLCLQAALHQNEKIQTIVEKCFKTDKETSVFLLLLYKHIRSYEALEGRNVLPALQSVYSSLPKIWSINLSDKKASLFLEVLKLQPVKKAVELTGWSEDESELKILLQCLPYISQLRFGFGLHGKRRQKTTLQFLVKLIAGATERSVETGENFTELLVSLCSFRNFSFSGEDEEFDSVAHCNLLLDLYLHAKDYESETGRSVLSALRSVYESLPEVWTISLMDKKALLFLEVLKLQTVKKVVELTGWSNEKRKVRSFIQCLPRISQLRLCSDILVKMPQRMLLRSHTLVAFEELLVTESSTKKPERMTGKILTRLQFLLRHWKIQCLNLTEYKMADESLLDLLNPQGPLTVRFSEETLQKLATVVYELQDEDLTRRFLQNVSGDLSSCSLGWDVIHWFLQHHTITVDIRKSTIYQENLQDLLLVLDKAQLKGLKSSFVLSVMRKLYETGSAHIVSSLLNSTEKCINLENRQLNSVDCAALRFTLQHCTGVSLNLLWASVPEGELQSIVPLLSHVSHLRVDRLLLLRLLHCCNIPELQKEAAVLLSALHHKLDFSCQHALDLTADTTTFSLVLSSDDCRIISMAIQRAHIHIQLVIQDCEMEEAAVEELFPVLHTVTMHCSKALLLRFLSHVDLGSEKECVRRAMALSQALRDKVDLSETQLNMQACKSLALVLEYSEELSQLDLSHCQISDDQLELLMPQLHKTSILDLSNNHITDIAARNIYNVLSINSNVQTVCLFNNRISDPSLFLQDKRFEIW